MRILFLDTKASNPNRYISRCVFEALQRRSEVTDIVWAEYNNALDLAASNTFDAFIAFDGEEADNLVVTRLTELVDRTAIWFTEDPYEAHRNVEVAARFDRVFTNDRSSCALYGPTAEHLPLGADKKRHFFPIEPARREFDVFFAGTAWPNRLEFLSELKQLVPFIQARFLLVSNAAIDPHIAHYRQQFALSHGVSIRDFCHIASRSSLTLALPRAFSGDPSRPQAASDTPGPRLFEIALAGSAQLVDLQTTPLASELLPQGSYFSYRDAKECAEHIQAVMHNPSSAIGKAKVAQEFVLSNHTYDHRVSVILDRLGGLAPRPLSRAPPKTKPRVLLISHNLMEHGNWGGSEIYAKSIQERTNNYSVDVLAPGPIRGNNFVLRSGEAHHHISISPTVEDEDLTHPGFENEFQHLLAKNSYDIIHINHLMHYPLSVPILAKASGAKVVFSLHDYYSLCPNFNLIGFEGRYCHIPERPKSTCDPCLGRTRGYPPGSQARRRRFLRESLARVDLFLAGSRASAEIFNSLYPGLAPKVMELPPPLPGKLENRRNTSFKQGDVLQVALLGNFTQQKGGDTALKVFEAMIGDRTVFHIFGRVDDEFAGRLNGLQNVRQHGMFEPGTLPADLYSCAVALFLSPWPETYCISLSEAQSAGLVPIATNLGAQAERIKPDIDGLLIDVNKPAEVVSILRSLLNSPERLLRMAAAQPKVAGLSVDAFAARLEQMYDVLLKDRSPLPPAQNASRCLTTDELGIYLQFARWDAGQRSGLSPALIEMGSNMTRFARVLRQLGLVAAVSRLLQWAYWRHLRPLIVRR